MTATDLAERWTCSVGHLANLRYRGESIPFGKLAGRIVYRYADVVAYESAAFAAAA